LASAVSIKSSGSSSIANNTGSQQSNEITIGKRSSRKRKETLPDQESQGTGAEQQVVYDDPDGRAAKKQMMSKLSLSTIGE
jgi:hypothetical protein